MIMIIYNNIIIMNNNGYVIEVWVGWDVLGAATVDSQARTAEGKGRSISICRDIQWFLILNNVFRKPKTCPIHEFK